MFATKSKFNNGFVVAGWTVSLALHATVALWLVHLARQAALPPCSPAAAAARTVPPPAPLTPPDVQRAIDKARKSAIEIEMRRGQIAAVRERVEREYHRIHGAHSGLVAGEHPEGPSGAPASAADPVGAAAMAVRQAVGDFEAIRAGKMAIDGGVPLDDARQLANGDPLAQTARTAAQSGDLDQMLLSMRALAGAAHNLPVGPTGVTAAVTSDGSTPSVREMAEGQAVDLTVPWQPAPLAAAGQGFGPITAVAGRRVAAGGDHADWLFIDSWYCVGPFPNSRRSNLDTPFEPESIVNLDAAYLGKKDRPVSWQFLQSPSPDVVPLDAEEYAIYYLYTEVQFDRACDLWIAAGSDDQSKIWINGDKVWQSSDDLKGWKIDEGFRKVHFYKGINRILARLENGWRGTAISLCIKLS
ncbi:MAG: hypothetical protein P4L33_00970 [Capsulimonadaceae bacterium]|nr:hypothetical protein [Capsulimonadaceae bacterium]